MNQTKYTLAAMVMVVLLLGVSTAAATDTVTRTLPETAFPGDNVTVNLTINFDDQTAVDRLVITETVPAGWEIVDASNSGILTRSGKIFWIIIGTLGGTIPPDGAVFTYNVTVPPDASGTYPFSGIYGTNTAGTNLNVSGDANLTIDTCYPPTLKTYTITNTTITPPQTTDIDVRFSEQVSATIKIEDTVGNLIKQLYHSSGVTNPSPKHWDGTYTNGTTVPDGMYIVNVTGVNTTTGLSVVNTSETITVSTGEDTTPPVITDVGNTTPTTDSVTIIWTTDEESDSLVRYGTVSGTYTDGESSAAMVTSHNITLTGLSANTTYYFVVSSTDASDNSNESSEHSFRTAATADTTPPVITDVGNTTPTTDSVTIIWTTDEESDSLVRYGTVSGTYTDGESSAAMVTSHNITLTGLSANTTYYFVVSSTDASDNSNESSEHSFRTAATADTTAPTIIVNAPTGAGVPVSKVINVTFDEAMNPASVKDAFSIDPDVAGSFSWVGTTMTFNPDTLAYGTTYTVTLGTGATDLAGNPLGGAFNWDFTTESAPAPTITSRGPASQVNDIAGAARRFSITVDQTVNVTWLINGTQVQLNVSVTEASYTNTTAVPGCWNVSAVAENKNGTDMQTWIWNVAETTGVNVTDKNNFTAVSGDANVTGNFSNPLYGWINVTDTGDDPAASPDVNNSTLRAGLGDRDVFVGSVYIDASMSNIEEEMAAGNGSIRIELHYTDEELAALGIDEDTLDIYRFNTTTDMWELVRSQSYCIDSGRNTTANYVWVNVTELSTFALVGSKPAPPQSSRPSRGGGGGGGSGTYPPGWGETTLAATPGVTPGATPTVTPPGEAVATPTKPAVAEETPSAVAEETPTEKKSETPGFTAVFAITGLLAIAYVLMRRRE